VALAGDGDEDVDTSDHPQATAERGAALDDPHGNANVLSHPYHPANIGAAVKRPFGNPSLEQAQKVLVVLFSDQFGTLKGRHVGRDSLGTVKPVSEPACHDHRPATW
jgi:hypothetical protein